MFLKTLKLANFRNFSQLSLKLSLTTLFLGNNAQGKSNLLESIYFLATTKSPRVEKDVQLILYGENFARVEGEVGDSTTEGDSLTTLEVIMQANPEKPELVEKRVKVNGVSRRVIDYVGALTVIYFSPEDINLVTGSPSLRRYHIDLTLSQVDRQYKKALVGYNQVLVSRNRLLKRIREGQAKLNELDFWTSEQVKYGQVISEKRESFFRFINGQNNLGDFLGTFKFVYEASLLSLERIKEYQERELEATSSLIGPHRDDFIFEANGRNLAYFGSRGEQRTAVLKLKLAELNYFKEVKQTSPILLLDDVFSELDTPHRDLLVSVFDQQQTIITAVENETIPQELLKKGEIFKIEQGRVELFFTKTAG